MPARHWPDRPRESTTKYLAARSAGTPILLPPGPSYTAVARSAAALASPSAQRGLTLLLRGRACRASGTDKGGAQRGLHQAPGPHGTGTFLIAQGRTGTSSRTLGRSTEHDFDVQDVVLALHAAASAVDPGSLNLTFSVSVAAISDRFTVQRKDHIAGLDTGRCRRSVGQDRRQPSLREAARSSSRLEVHAEPSGGRVEPEPTLLLSRRVPGVRLPAPGAAECTACGRHACGIGPATTGAIVTFSSCCGAGSVKTMCRRNFPRGDPSLPRTFHGATTLATTRIIGTISATRSTRWMRRQSVGR